MSTPVSPRGPSGSKEVKNKKGFGKMLSRVKTVLKRGEGSSKRQSILSPTQPPQPTETGKPEAPKKTEMTPEQKAAEARARYEAMAGVSKVSRAQLFEERAKKLGERFGLELSAAEWKTASIDDTILRMDKPIRMRVRRNCHRCNAAFGIEKECPNCQHVRCTKCVRYPPKRTEAELIASRERRAAILQANKENAPIIADYGWDEKEYVIKRPSKTGGQDLVHKKPRQRIRRTCHECKALFITGSKQCEKCGHARCTDCPREPPKKDKYPFGYPGDEFGPNSVPHYECVSCKRVYPTGAEHGTECKTCGTAKTDESPRALPRKVEPEPDQEILKQLQARLESLKVA